MSKALEGDSNDAWHGGGGYGWCGAAWRALKGEMRKVAREWSSEAK
jgi:hypothetical protein